MFMVEELISKSIKNNRRAQQQLYALLKNKIMGICYRYIPNKPDREDVFQEVMVKIFKNLPSLKEPKALHAWSRRVAITTALNYLNKQSCQHSDIEEVSTVPAPDLNILTDMHVEDLVKLIHDLPYTYRTTFNLFVIDGYSHKEIASMMGVSPNTSKSNLRCAKQALVEKIKRQELKHMYYA